jgi:hypothetical protein
MNIAPSVRALDISIRRRTLARTRAVSPGFSPLAGSPGVGAAKPFEFDGEAEGDPSGGATNWMPGPAGAVGCGVADGGGAFGAVTACARLGGETRARLRWGRNRA